MLNFILNQILFYAAILLILFIPGYFLLRAIEAKKKLFNSLERFVFSFGFSILIVDFLMILIGKFGILFSKFSIISAISLFSLVCYVISKIIQLRTRRRPVLSEAEANGDKKESAALDFSKNQKILIILLLFLTVFIKTAYLKNTIFPTSTDLGHHMYWAKVTAETGKLPVYQESDIVEVDGKYQISQPQTIADFIIGEHLIFAAINLISGANFISAFPSLVLMLVNIVSILAIFILTLKFFENCAYGKNVALLSLFFIGPLYALSSPQEKFVSGGVIGNLIGNLLIPLSLYFLFRAFAEKNRNFLATSFFLIFGLFYTHHLSAFIFLFVLFFTAIIFFALNIKNISEKIKEWIKLLSSPHTIIFFVIAVLFFFLVYTPSYFDPKAVGTAVGGPSKDTRSGLTFSQFKLSSGEARMALGLIGIAVLLAAKKRTSYRHAMLLGWSISLLIMTLKPEWLFLDLPSGRIASYAAYPLSIISAFAIARIFVAVRPLRSGPTATKSLQLYIDSKTLSVLSLILIVFILTNAFSDNSGSLNASNNNQEAAQTFDASQYLAKATDKTDLIVKDHNYITADSWIKLYFARAYNFPFSRGYFKRYEDVKKRETCTLWMISTPNTPNGQKCFNDMGVNFIMVNPRFDSTQFQKSPEFWQVYSGKEINVYYRK